MSIWRTTELAVLKGVSRKYSDPKGGSLREAENCCIMTFQSLLRVLVTSEYFFLNFDIFTLNVNKKQIGYTACSITL
jgi:hypothetical protein